MPHASPNAFLATQIEIRMPMFLTQVDALASLDVAAVVKAYLSLWKPWHVIERSAPRKGWIPPTIQQAQPYLPWLMTLT